MLFQGQDLPGVTRDISQGGICMVCPSSVIRGAWIKVLLSLILDEKTFSESLEVTGKVVWCTPLGEARYQLGISFDRLDEARANYLDIFLRLLKGEIVIDLPEAQPLGEKD